MSEHPAKKRKLISLRSVPATDVAIPCQNDAYLPNLEKSILSKLESVCTIPSNHCQKGQGNIQSYVVNKHATEPIETR